MKGGAGGSGRARTPVHATVGRTCGAATDPDTNQRRILDACPQATEVRTFHGWLAAGRVVLKGKKGIRIVAPDTIDDGKVTSIKPVYVFDVTQTQERTARTAA